MSGYDTDRYKTNYFGTFLDVMNAPAPAPRPAPAPPVARPVSDGADPMLRELSRLGGIAALKDLLPVADYSVDRLMANVHTLDALGLVKNSGGIVAMTPSGHEVASKKTSTA